ncbi:MAG: toll/interleukin-1 receptor domain-containing protein [Rectinema sp.]
MIFLSHNSNDKAVVETIALELEPIFGRDNIFYDSWSIQPGDGIIDKMSEALEKCTLFLFFVSKNSLQSNMVKLEWQNAVLRATHGKTRIVPVKLDDCMMPPILLQTFYIDLFGQGLDIAIRQIVDVASGNNAFRPGPQEFHNLRAYAYDEDGKKIIECRAEFYLEPKTHFLFIIRNNEGELEFMVRTASMFTGSFNRDLDLGSGIIRNGQMIAVEGSTVPGFPFIVQITPKPGITIALDGVMHEKRMGEWHWIPLINGRPTN